ncbi:hypothetical protein M0R88_17295 [Halorussus gelatinilyticus]|uniref:CHAT domain-containing protein n=1 Tax=Halorussus gelatinilyticus TaxID=2937524 RepID=A0A8U0IHV4_9EURY|nr:hypothetical protein [Halorussus gelatinilyticus]UPW00251.1 hypothetical protein M0R88_17295 [Halorussus gelatinilyticus]
MDPTFTVRTDYTAVEIADPIENARFELYTASPVEPSPVPTDEFYFPVDSAIAVESSAVDVPKLANVLVRTQSGELVADNADHADRSLDHGAYVLELSTAPMKLYLSVESSLEVRHGEATVTVDFGDETVVGVGARSFHDRPAGTVTTTPDPVGTMDAVSLFGSALKTTSPERSFPTLRGHPPLVELGDEFDAPEGIARPDTGVRLELPADYRHVYPAASLAYYLGAEVVPADHPRLVTDAGFEYDLDGPRGYETTVGRVLRQTFLFDCVTRTEGYYDVDLHEREAVEPEVELDFAALYDRPLAERLDAYLSVPFESVADHVPDWSLTTDVMATPNNAEVLPFVAADLALVRCPSDPTGASVSPTPEPLGEFFRNDPDGDAVAESAVGANKATALFAPTALGDDFTRSTTDESGSAVTQGEIFNPEPVETVEHAWIGEGFPVGANKATVESYRRRVRQSAPDKTTIEIHVVCNDERMQAEGVVEEFYGPRELLQFDVSVHNELTTDELRDLLAQPADFLHYIGHVDGDGMRCPDGHLDARTLSEVNVKAFVLNACRSYAQGEALVEAGSYGGVVTLAEIANSVATDIGQTLARLLNCGFPLRVALAVVKDAIGPAYQYTTVGDGNLTLCQSESGCPLHLKIEQVCEDEFEANVRAYSSPGYELGSIYFPIIGQNSVHQLVSAADTSLRVTRSELDDYFEREVMPVNYEGNLYWTDELAGADL